MDSQPKPDARVDAMPIDAPPCVPGYIDLCNTAARTDMFTPSANTEIDTGSDARCTVKTQTNGPDLCILYFTKVDIPTGVRVDVHGNRALVLASTSTLAISGTLDASAHRATQGSQAVRGPASNFANCAFTANPESDGGGGGGGAGGTFATQGGTGGIGDENDSNGQGGTATGGVPGTAVAEPPTVLRGGCPGQKGGDAVGAGGGGANSGGAVYLFAKGNLSIGGKVQATGAGGSSGGNRAGGGGGGSGGYIVIESETQSAITGTLLATGGGAGEGGSNIGTPDPGDDPTSANPAAGGARVTDGGNGGAGATYLNNAVVAPGTGMPADGGGGGGGGGNGYIYIRGMGRMVNGTTAPLPIQPMI